MGYKQVLVQIRKVFHAKGLGENKREEEEGRKIKISNRMPRDSSGIRQGDPYYGTWELIHLHPNIASVL